MQSTIDEEPGIWDMPGLEVIIEVRSSQHQHATSHPLPPF